MKKRMFFVALTVTSLTACASIWGFDDLSGSSASGGKGGEGGAREDGGGEGGEATSTADAGTNLED